MQKLFPAQPLGSRPDSDPITTGIDLSLVPWQALFHHPSQVVPLVFLQLDFVFSATD
jgi:hypothetical protein